MSTFHQASRRTADSSDSFTTASLARTAPGKSSRTAGLPASAPVQRKEAPAAPAADTSDVASRISTQDIQYEIIAHKLGYQDTIGSAEAALLASWGYEPSWAASINDAATGFFVGLLVPDADHPELTPILVFRGTGDFRDVVSDLHPGAVGANQFRANQRFVSQLIAEAGGRVDVTGHSLGGALAQHAAVAFTGSVNRVVTFQAPGVRASQAASFDEAEDRPSVTHHIAGGDLVDTAGRSHLSGEFFRHTPGGGPMSHTKFLLTTPELQAQRDELGLTDEVLAELGIDRETNRKPIEHHEDYPHEVKSAINETVRRGLGAVLYPVLNGVGVLTRNDDAGLRTQISEMGEEGLVGTPVSERAYMVDRLCRGATGNKDEDAILTVLRASARAGDAVAVIDLVDAHLIAKNVHGKQYKELRAFYRSHYYTQCSQERALALILRCIDGRTPEWEEEMIADILEARSDGRAIITRIGAHYKRGGFREGLSVLQWQLDGRDQRRVDAIYAN